MCNLCNIDKSSTWYYEDEDIIVCECIKCKIPLVTTKLHTIRPGRHIEMKMISKLNYYAEKFYDNTKFFIDTNQNYTNDHVYWHARPK